MSPPFGLRCHGTASRQALIQGSQSHASRRPARPGVDPILRAQAGAEPTGAVSGAVPVWGCHPQLPIGVQLIRRSVAGRNLLRIAGHLHNAGVATAPVPTRS